MPDGRKNNRGTKGNKGGRPPKADEIKKIEPQTITVGAAALDREYANQLVWGATQYTYFNPNETLSGSGTIDTVEIWLNYNSGGTDTWAGLGSISGTTITTRDSESLGDVSAGSKQEITGLSIDGVIGDLIGVANKSVGDYVKLETGPTGDWYRVEGEYIDPDDSASYTLSETNNQLSLYGTGTEAAAGLSIPVAMHHYKMMRS